MSDSEYVPARLNLIPPWDPVQRQHYWAVQMIFRLSEKAIRPDSAPILDRENLVQVSPPVCYHCEIVYNRKQAALPCEGDAVT